MIQNVATPNTTFLTLITFLQSDVDIGPELRLDLAQHAGVLEGGGHEVPQLRVLLRGGGHAGHPGRQGGECHLEEGF